ncbi:MAG TPA: M24 family metallopeptidase [Opitutales bacterium]|nr:M24 family metallopeptidase [Opitutales bacterium]
MARARKPVSRPKRSPAACPLLYAASETNADQLYFGRFFAPDAYLAFGPRGQRVAVMNALEYGRALKESEYDTVLRLEEWQTRARDYFKRKDAGLAHIVKLLADEYGVKRYVVPPEFPAGLLTKLRALQVPVEVSDGPLFPERAIKTREEAACVREGCAASAAGLWAAEKALRRSKVRRDGELYLDGEPLTSERLRFLVDVACMENGAIAQNTIVAGGQQACDPHCRGSGPLWARDLIIVDVFPRITETGYYGDMTRTFLKGRASEPQRALVDAVRRAQKVAFKKIGPGVSGKKVHHAVQKFFAKLGYETRRKPTHHEGFFHGTGHGLGLEVHEPPRVGLAGSPLREGMVVTVEPGLYYPGLGGCRIEDVVQVTDDGHKLLSDYDYNWELP